MAEEEKLLPRTSFPKVFDPDGLGPDFKFRMGDVNQIR